MSATNLTPIINLPLFIGTDKPAWLTDWNGAMNIIDSAIAALQTAESGTATSLASLAQSVEALSSTVSQHTTAIQTVADATATNTGSINTITSLIGNGQPTTTDKTLIGAINEINAEIGAAEKNNLTPSVTITSYDAYNNLYTVPEDGYIGLYVSTSGSSSVAIYGADTTASSDTHIVTKNTASETVALTYVRKGMKVYCTVSGSGSAVVFYAFA